MENIDKRNMPGYLIVLSLIFIFPLGIYFLVLKTENHLYNIKKVSRLLFFSGYSVLVFLIFYFIINYPRYVSLIDSHMSLDMYSFSFIYLYIFFLMIIISTIVGGSFLNKKCEKLVIYTEFINIRHIKDISIISEETLETKDEIKNNINKLIEKGFIINVRIEDDHLVSTKTVDKKNNNDLVKCKSCGNIKKLEEEKTKCDFCCRKLNKKDML